MPRKIAAGCLVRATFDGEVRYLLVHPSGRYNRRQPYSIPKGLVEPGELPEQAALRETREETGLDCRILAPLGEIDYVKSRKTVIAYLAEPLAPPLADAQACRLGDRSRGVSAGRSGAPEAPPGPAAVARSGAGDGRRPRSPVMSRAPRCEVKYAHAHSNITITRLRKPIRKTMCTTIHRSQATKPDSRTKPKSATAAALPIVARFPLST